MVSSDGFGSGQMILRQFMDGSDIFRRFRRFSVGSWSVGVSLVLTGLLHLPVQVISGKVDTQYLNSLYL